MHGSLPVPGLKGPRLEESAALSALMARRVAGPTLHRLGRLVAPFAPPVPRTIQSAHAMAGSQEGQHHFVPGQERMFPGLPWISRISGQTEEDGAVAYGATRLTGPP